MPTPSQAQIFAGLRYAGVIAGTGLTAMAGLGALSPDTAHAIVTQIQLVTDDLQKTIGDAWKLGLLLAPVVTVYLAKVGYSSASLKKQIAAVQGSPKAQVTVTDPKLAEGIPGVKVAPL